MGAPSKSEGAGGRVRRSDLVCWALVLGALVAWWAMVIGAPRACAGGGRLAQAGAVCYLLLSRVCHQEPSRCLWVGGAPLGLCARCTGIWGGATLGVLLLPLAAGMGNRRIPHRRYLLAAAALVALDVGSEWLGLREPIPWLRVATGGMLGLAAACYVMPAILLAADEKRKERVPCNQPTRAVTT
jgi:uncharacterized membrane protein